MPPIQSQTAELALSIGSDDGCQWIVKERGVAPIHARVLVFGEHVLLEPFKSELEVAVKPPNGAKAKAPYAMLFSDTTIYLGDFAFPAAPLLDLVAQQ